LAGVWARSKGWEAEEVEEEDVVGGVDFSRLPSGCIEESVKTDTQKGNVITQLMPCRFRVSVGRRIKTWN